MAKEKDLTVQFCECEHDKHFTDHHVHAYGQVKAEVKVDTIAGTFNVCNYCNDTCMTRVKV